MTIVAFLQNAWFRDPERTRKIFDRNPNSRERLVRSFLFGGCLTGRRLHDTLGAQLCHEIVWEEISREIGGHSGSSFPADMSHIRTVLHKHQPSIILTFGVLARDALLEWRESASLEVPPRPMPIILCAPHPAARYPEVEDELIAMRQEIFHVEQDIFGIARDKRGCYAAREDGKQSQSTGL